MKSASLPLAGSKVGGKYRLERYIAEGGMACIAVARHLELDEEVALKFLKPAVLEADPTGEIGGRFLREARATIKIRSEHVPRILDVATTEDGLPYIVMELLLGEDLDQRVERNGPLPTTEAVDFTLQALEALAAAHALGIIHRDLKPANVYIATGIDGSACVKVLDFGIAKLIDQNATGVDQGLTGTTAVMGSPRYMAPEQMRSSRDVDERADIWAIGTTLFEALCGVPPFSGDSLTAVCASILQDDPPSITKGRPDVAPKLEAIIHKCLSKRADGRFSDVAQLAAALAPFGTQPVAQEVAARVARVRRPAGIISSSSGTMKAVSVTGPALVASRPSAPVGAMGMTDTSWGAQAAPQPNRRKVWTVALVFGALFAIGSALGAVALLRPHKTTGAAVVATPPAEPPPPTTTTPPEPPPPVIALPTSEPAPPPTTSAAPTPTEPKPHHARPSGTKPAPNGTPAAPAASNGNLWDDRK